MKNYSRDDIFDEGMQLGMRGAVPFCVEKWRLPGCVSNQAISAELYCCFRMRFSF